jgi:lipopolysaccharide/colanic/teichoic acid biosynthesis glycosyltransferase
MKYNLAGRLIAVIALVATLPLLVACVVAIYLEDRGAILFRQVRVGIGGKPFCLLKLRSMRTSRAGQKITAGGDARITAVGRWLRDFKLDELPQLWNVVRGDMNLIGPRPEVPEYVDLSDSRWAAVLAFRPGITDLSSLVFRNEERMLAGQEDVETFYREWLLPRKLEMSTHYAQNRSLLTDARLISLTLRHVITRREMNRDEIRRQFSYGGTLTWTR